MFPFCTQKHSAAELLAFCWCSLHFSSPFCTRQPSASESLELHWITHAVYIVKDHIGSSVMQCSIIYLHQDWSVLQRSLHMAVFLYSWKREFSFSFLHTPAVMMQHLCVCFSINIRGIYKKSFIGLGNFMNLFKILGLCYPGDFSGYLLMLLLCLIWWPISTSLDKTIW